MEKKIYEKPVMQVERFVPNDYCMICHGEGYTIWTATCRSSQEGSCMIFFDAPEDQNGQWTSDAYRGGCGKSHEFKLEDGVIPTANCWLLTSVQLSGGSIPQQYRQYFDPPYTLSYDSEYHWHGAKLNQAGIDHFTNNGLVRGYYNGHILDSGRWLVTDKPSDIKTHS